MKPLISVLQDTASSLATGRWKGRGEELGWLHHSEVLNKAQLHASPISRPDNKTLLPLLPHTSFHSHCLSQMLLMFKKQPEAEPTKPRHKELIKPSEQTPSQKEFNQRFKIIKRTWVYLTFTALQCSTTKSLAEWSEIHQSQGSSWATDLAFLLMKSLVLGTPFPSLWSSFSPALHGKRSMEECGRLGRKGPERKKPLWKKAVHCQSSNSLAH